VVILVAASVLLSTIGVGAGASGVEQPIATGPSFSQATVTVPLRGRAHQPKIAVAVRQVASASGHRLVGAATWYRYHPGQAAAGPRLRAALGSHWRGRYVRVNGLRVRLTDWCACPFGRVVDLHVGDFARLARPSTGVLRVSVAW